MTPLKMQRRNLGYLSMTMKTDWCKPLFLYLSKDIKKSTHRDYTGSKPGKIHNMVVTYTYTHPRAQSPFSFFSLYTNGCFPLANRFVSKFSRSTSFPRINNEIFYVSGNFLRDSSCRVLKKCVVTVESAFVKNGCRALQLQRECSPKYLFWWGGRYHLYSN